MDESSILSQIPHRIYVLLQEIGAVGENAARSVYVVGGFVRDFLLERENLDLDIVLEGDAIRFANRLAEAWRGTVQSHQQFGTATVTRPDGLKIDFVSARSETYASPGALPSIKYSTIEVDLRRRDFSTNALAIQLNPGAFGEIVDCTHGIRDLRAGCIRVLHDQSFIDDPTRIFRAIRYEQRYGFQIIEGDQKRIREAVDQGVLDLISGQRIRSEIDRILLEEAAPRMVRRMLEFDLFWAIHPAWGIPPNFDALWNAAHQAIDWAATHLPDDQLDPGVILWMPLLTAPASLERKRESPRSLGGEGRGPSGTAEAVSDRLALENQLQAKLIAKDQLWHVLEPLSASSRPSEVYKLLNSYPLEPLIFALKAPNQPDWRREKIRDYLIHARGVQPLINGDDLIQLGLKPGRLFAEVLWKAFAAQLDGKVLTKQEAYQFLANFFARKKS